MIVQSDLEHVQVRRPVVSSVTVAPFPLLPIVSSTANIAVRACLHHNSIPRSRPAWPRPRSQRHLRPSCGLIRDTATAHPPPRPRPERHRQLPSPRFTAAGPASS